MQGIKSLHRPITPTQEVALMTSQTREAIRLALSDAARSRVSTGRPHRRPEEMPAAATERPGAWMLARNITTKPGPFYGLMQYEGEEC